MRTGILVVAPLLLVWRGWREFRPKRSEVAMLAVLAAALGLAAWIDRALASQAHAPLANPVLLYLSIPLRSGRRSASRCLARPLSRSWPR